MPLRSDSALMKLFYSNTLVNIPPIPAFEDSLSDEALRPNPNLRMTQRSFPPKSVFMAFNAMRGKLSRCIENWNRSGSNDSAFGNFCAERGLVYLFYVVKHMGECSTDGSPKVNLPGWMRRDVQQGFKVGGGCGSQSARVSSGAARASLPGQERRQSASGLGSGDPLRKRGGNGQVAPRTDPVQQERDLASAITLLAPPQPTPYSQSLSEDNQLNSVLNVSLRLTAPGAVHISI